MHAFIMLPESSRAATECPIQFHGATDAEMQASCESFEKVLIQFKKMGMEVRPNLNLFFADEIFLPTVKDEKISVRGYFDTSDNSIHMVHLDASSQKERMPWGQGWTLPMATSFLTHEMAHLLAIEFMGSDFKRLPHHWHEFVAYALQFQLMDPSLREKVLQQNSSSAFDRPEDVSASYYEIAPDIFAIKSYLAVKKWGEATFLKDLLTGKIQIQREAIL